MANVDSSKWLVLKRPEVAGFERPLTVDRFWCTFDVTANGYVPLNYNSLADYQYDDNGYDKAEKLHRFEFVIEMQRKR